MSQQLVCDGCGKQIPQEISTAYYHMTYKGLAQSLTTSDDQDYCVPCMNLMVHMLKHRNRLETDPPNWPNPGTGSWVWTSSSNANVLHAVKNEGEDDGDAPVPARV